MTDQLSVTLRLGDCLEVMRELPTASIDAVVTDPPYGISFMGKHWDRFDIDERVGRRDVSKLGTRLTGAADTPNRKETARTASAYANAAGEAGGYDFTLTGARRFQEAAERWATEWLRVLKPGGYAVVFGSTRMYHRLASGMEDAGFEIRDTLAWMFGQGFPKSLNLDGQFDGWGTALKPGFEPIVLARKPLAGTTLANMAEHGVGALHIDSARIPIDAAEAFDGGGRGTSSRQDGWQRPWKDDPATVEAMQERRRASIARSEDLGRWPANVLLDEEAAAMLDEQTGELHSQDPATRLSTSNTVGVTGMGTGRSVEYADRGGASRFFYCAKVSTAERNAGCEPSLLNPDAPERNHHPTVKPLALMRWLIRLVTAEGATVLEPFAGSGSTVCAAALEGRDCIAIEREPAYMEVTRARVAYWSGQLVGEIV